MPGVAEPPPGIGFRAAALPELDEAHRALARGREDPLQRDSATIEVTQGQDSMAPRGFWGWGSGFEPLELAHIGL